jgi:hypothetical protein
MSNPIKISAKISLPEKFEFGAVDHSPITTRARAVLPTNPPLGPLAHFVGSWNGSGFNTIFRPDNSVSASSMNLPIPLPPGDNLLELNLTSETLTFSQSLGSVPNRGLATQADAFLNGVTYLQAINDVTTPGQAVGIHVEPGIWMMVPATTAPAEGRTLVRMASIPHGTTIEAQGTFATAPERRIFPRLTSPHSRRPLPESRAIPNHDCQSSPARPPPVTILHEFLRICRHLSPPAP